MTAAPGAWPSSRHLLGWWRELADLGPRRLWVGRLPVHRVEALAAVRRSRPLDPLRRALLHFLSLHSLSNNGEAPWPRLQVDAPLLAQLLRGLAGQGLVEGRTSDWVLTTAGRQALEANAILEMGHERRTFAFLDRTAAHQAPHLLPLSPAASATPSAETWPFAPTLLEDCVRQTEAWKARWGFPADVEAVLLPEGREGAEPPDWQRVVLDCPEEVMTLLVEPSAPAAGEPTGPLLIAFAVQPPNWALQRTAAVLELDEGWEEVFAGLTEAPSVEQWKQAWRAWCQQRNVPAGEADASALEFTGNLLRVRAPQRLIERLRAARSDAVKQEAWLLAGAGRVRSAARIDLLEGEAGR
jgi:hypothetical protein